VILTLTPKPPVRGRMPFLPPNQHGMAVYPEFKIGQVGSLRSVIILL